MNCKWQISDNHYRDNNRATQNCNSDIRKHLTQGCITRGKYTACIVVEFADKETTTPIKVFAKQPQISTPSKIQTAYIWSVFPVSIEKRK